MFVHFVTHTLSQPFSCRVYDTNVVNALHMTNHMRDLQFIYNIHLHESGHDHVQK